MSTQDSRKGSQQDTLDDRKEGHGRLGDNGQAVDLLVLAVSNVQEK